LGTPWAGQVEALERVIVFTPFGVRFWDAAFDRRVDDGLRVVGWPLGRPGAARGAFLTTSGVYALRDLPGLQAVEFPDANAPAGRATPPVGRLVVAARDTLGRFLPVVFSADVPFRGVFPTGTGAGSGGPLIPGFFLFSAPTRPGAPNLGLVRAELKVFRGGRLTGPAAFAAVELDVEGGPRVYGMADDRGRVALLLPYPPFREPPSARSPIDRSPAAPPAGAVRLRVRYDPGWQVWSDGADVPELGSVVSQPYAAVWPSLSPASPADSASATLVFGSELRVGTEGAPGLLISPLGSPL
jgi:hypothetical protein